MKEAKKREMLGTKYSEMPVYCMNLEFNIILGSGLLGFWRFI